MPTPLLLVIGVLAVLTATVLWLIRRSPEGDQDSKGFTPKSESQNAVVKPSDSTIDKS